MYPINTALVPLADSHRTPSQGVALIAALAFLLILTILGVAAFSSSAMQDKMTYASSDYHRAFASADSAISEAEAWISIQTVLPVEMQSCTSTCIPMVWQKDYPLQNYSGATGAWPSFRWSNYARSFQYDYGTDGTATPRASNPTAPTDPTMARTSTPLYVIEELGRDRTSSLDTGQGRQSRRYYYRVTAKGTGVMSNAYLQSVYVQSFN